MRESGTNRSWWWPFAACTALSAPTLALCDPAWTQRPAGGPGPRSNHVLVYDPVNDRTLLLGGLSNPPPFLDMWAFEPVSGVWTQLPAVAGRWHGAGWGLVDWRGRASGPAAPDADAMKISHSGAAGHHWRTPVDARFSWDGDIWGGGGCAQGPVGRRRSYVRIETKGRSR